MKTLTELMLEATETFSEKLGPVTTLVNRLAERLMPEVVVKACGGALCYTYCSGYCYKPCGSGWGIQSTILWGYFSNTGCPSNITQCAIDCGCNCSCSYPSC